ncbi:hypothetical protein HDU96_007597 [Phlyctochytrium bullatum]|nr:hypothetical protein HDU96_007597 [Phlyctochytrium bullatum]
MSADPTNFDLEQHPFTYGPRATARLTEHSPDKATAHGARQSACASAAGSIRLTPKAATKAASLCGDESPLKMQFASLDGAAHTLTTLEANGWDDRMGDISTELLQTTTMPSHDPPPPRPVDAPSTSKPGYIPILPHPSSSSTAGPLAPISTSASTHHPSSQSPSSPQSATLNNELRRPGPIRASCAHCFSRKRRCNGTLSRCAKRSALLSSSRTAPSSSGSALGNKRPLLAKEHPQTPHTPPPLVIRKSLDPLCHLLSLLDSASPLFFAGDTSGDLSPASTPAAGAHAIHTYLTSTQGFTYEVFSRTPTTPSIPPAGPLGLALTCFCSLFATPSAPYPVSAKLYAQARRTIPTCLARAGLESLQTLLLLTFCATSLEGDAARNRFRGMAFRMAALLGLDGERLIEFPGEPARIPTEEEREVRDLCWRACVFLDNVSTWPLSSPPQEFRPTHPHAHYFRFLAPTSLARPALIHHFTTLTVVLREILRLPDAPTLTALQTAAVRLAGWRDSLPPALALDDPGFWRGGEGGRGCGTRASILLGYHAARCVVGRAALRVGGAPQLVRDAAKSAGVVVAVGMGVGGCGYVNVQPFMAQCGLMAGMFVVEKGAWVEWGGSTGLEGAGEEWEVREVRERERRGAVRELRAFVGRVAVRWRVAGAYGEILDRAALALELGALVEGDRLQREIRVRSADLTQGWKLLIGGAKEAVVDSNPLRSH